MIFNISVRKFCRVQKNNKYSTQIGLNTNFSNKPIRQHYYCNICN
jgi:hypothetical protein